MISHGLDLGYVCFGMERYIFEELANKISLIFSENLTTIDLAVRRFFSFFN
jgi:hypothetical protein